MSCTKNLLILAAFIIVFILMTRKSKSKESFTDHSDFVLSDINQKSVVDTVSDVEVNQKIDSNVSTDAIFGKNYTFVNDDEENVSNIQEENPDNSNLEEQLSEYLEDEEIEIKGEDNELNSEVSQFVYSKPMKSESKKDKIISEVPFPLEEGDDFVQYASVDFLNPVEDEVSDIALNTEFVDEEVFDKIEDENEDIFEDEDMIEDEIDDIVEDEIEDKIEDEIEDEVYDDAGNEIYFKPENILDEIAPEEDSKEIEDEYAPAPISLTQFASFDEVEPEVEPELDENILNIDDVHHKIGKNMQTKMSMDGDSVPSAFDPIDEEDAGISFQTLEDEILSYSEDKEDEIADQSVESTLLKHSDDSVFKVQPEEIVSEEIVSQVSVDNNKIMDEKSEHEMKHRFKDQVKAGTFIEPGYYDRTYYAPYKSDINEYEPTSTKVKKMMKTLPHSTTLRQFYNQSIPTFGGKCTDGKTCETKQKGINADNCLVDYGIYNDKSYYKNSKFIGKSYDNDSCHAKF